MTRRVLARAADRRERAGAAALSARSSVTGLAASRERVARVTEVGAMPHAEVVG